MTTATGLILWSFSVVFIVLGITLAIVEIVNRAFARRQRHRQHRINVERHLRAAVARHPAGKRN